MIREMNRMSPSARKLPLRFVLLEIAPKTRTTRLKFLKTASESPIVRIKQIGAHKKKIAAGHSRTEGAILVKDLFA